MPSELTSSAEEKPSGITYYLATLGDFRLTCTSTGEDCTPKGRKARALLAFLVLNHGEVRREKLMGMLWGGRGEEQARGSLRQTLFELRHLTDGNTALLTVGRDHLCLNPALVATDIQRISDLARRNRASELIQALNDWRGPLFGDLSSIDQEFDEWLTGARTREQERLLEIVAASGQTALDNGNSDGARAIANKLLDIDPANERALRLGLRADHCAGDATALHRRYGAFEERLREELGARPSIETQRLFQELSATAPAKAAFTPLVRTGISAPSSEKAQVHRVTTRKPAWFWATGVAVAVTLLVGAAWQFELLPWGNGTRAEPLVAVLAFDNLSSDPSTNYIADGISEEILTALTHAPGLRIIGRDSSFAYRGDRKHLAAEALGATHILNGAIHREGNRIRITAHLTDAGSNETIWSKGFDRDFKDTLALELEIAIAIAAALDAKLLITRPPSAVDPAVYDLYLRGREALRVRSKPQFLQAVSLLREAVTRDPKFVRGWATLAYAEWALAEHGDISLEDATKAVGAAKEAAAQALTLDPQNSDVYVVLFRLGGNDWAQDFALLKKGLSLDPNNPDLLLAHSGLLLNAGYAKDAVAEAERAYKLNPQDPEIIETYARALADAGRAGDARRMIEDAHTHLPMYLSLWRLRFYFMLTDKRFDEVEKMIAPNTVRPDGYIDEMLRRDRLYLKAFRSRKSEDIDLAFRPFFENRLDEEVDAITIVWKQAMLGKNDQAFATAAKYFRFSRVANHKPRTLDEEVYWKWHDYPLRMFLGPTLAPFRHDPRFMQLWDSELLTDYWLQTDKWPDFCADPKLPYDCKVEARKLIAARRPVN